MFAMQLKSVHYAFGIPNLDKKIAKITKHVKTVALIYIFKLGVNILVKVLFQKITQKMTPTLSIPSLHSRRQRRKSLV